MKDVILYIILILGVVALFLSEILFVAWVIQVALIALIDKPIPFIPVAALVAVFRMFFMPSRGGNKSDK